MLETAVLSFPFTRFSYLRISIGLLDVTRIHRQTFFGYTPVWNPYYQTPDLVLHKANLYLDTMLSTKLLVLSASLFAYALAQTKIAFTSVPAVAIAGQSYNISWGGGDGSDVTLTLRRGDSNSLKTVSTLADGVEETFFVWNVSKSLETASCVLGHIAV